MFERLKGLCLDKNPVDIGSRPNSFRSYDFYCHFFIGLAMMGEPHLTETSFTQFILHAVLSEAAGSVKVLPIGGIEHGVIFDKLKIILEVFCTF